MIVRLAHVCIETNDLKATETFYTALGAKRQFEFRNKHGELVGMYLYFGENSYIEVIKVSEVRIEGAVRHFALEVEDVNEVYEVLVEHGVEASPATLESDHTLMVTCHDPNGIFIELQQYTADSMQIVGGVCEVDYEP